jgi:hypothetical protein
MAIKRARRYERKRGKVIDENNIPECRVHAVTASLQHKTEEYAYHQTAE